MKLLSAIILSSAAFSHANASLYKHREPETDPLTARALTWLQLKRGAPNAPDGYTPQNVDCPSTRPSIRAATGLSSEEDTFRSIRIPNTIGPMRDLLSRMDITGLDTTTYLNTHANNMSSVPKIGIAVSGGGYRALMTGAGALEAFDSRTTNSTVPGQLGGLLQSSLYLAGLSGGGWLVGSIAMNNWTSVQDIVNSNGELWDFSQSIFEGPDGTDQLVTTTKYYNDIYDVVQGKNDAGYNTTVTDYWGRALAYQLVNATDGGPSYTWSSLATQEYVTEATFPLPILICDSRRPGEAAISTNTTIFEFNPWEMGSWDPTVYGFAPMKYVGSNFTNGQIPENESCVEGYDSASYIIGTSSTLFNEFALEFGMEASDLPEFVAKILQKFLDDFSETDNDIADWRNPFYQYNPRTNAQADTEQLTLVDGGENNENLPLNPLIQPVRTVDVIFAVDSSADTPYNWPNGSSLVASYERSLNGSLQNHTAFPSIPDENTFVNLGLNSRPTFFGCNGTNITDASDLSTAPTPLIVYLPNSPWTSMANLSTFDPSYSESQIEATIINGYNVVTRGNSSDQTWPTCVGCAILRRSLERTGTAIPEVCQTCFTNYCWNGTLAPNTPAPYEPTVRIPSAGSNTTSGSSSQKNAALQGIPITINLAAAAVLGAAVLLG